MTSSNRSLPWPQEAAQYPDESVRAFAAPGSNLALDFHGDPATAGLAVFSDGNHHMALEASIRAFLEDNPTVDDVFYTTTPPAPLVDALKGNGLVLGNLRISRKPDVFIGPGNILDELVDAELITRHEPFAESRGNVILVRKGNPKGITAVSDLLSDEITVACSNPVTEKASYAVYAEAARGLAQEAGTDGDAVVAKLSTAGPKTIHSQIIHHREIPELIGAGHADAAIIYYHLALRYTRIFPDIFELVDIGNVLSGESSAKNPTTRYHIGLVADGGKWGEHFVSFMQSNTAQSLYKEHGLLRLC
ncbi:MAG: substrate-binding domain-containing protein [Gammaproteobacteria bacterium]|nr:substrate-binding domain-containing protein [Gammaproteobacteria bacterium]